ncbi:hypothetical protein PUNSTDRAFT_72602 [Punctularia strigosozonata HHB-11173 SS5]|uniref:uncharacterized protein n=1 Tax=Punctularia strigosozonata (strain HHB-11173) TaxID=741275 RepID=UPI0004416D57|nr:uncharacterized protein PUNSTDRAFT_72602 [Punctularia strigosozonata HHB-11173 SS5]EIN06656.1 hypothetical protein PUNSTDRAFT_72602 [Punctularia strigosozonata HHB-11173 SS5]
MKTLVDLTAVTEYVKLRERYRAHPKCKRPCLQASLAIAKSMGKKPHFARRIRRNEHYLLRHHHLPLPRCRTRHGGQHSLLDNEDVMQKVRVYLAAKNLGDITPRSLMREVNNVIAPALGYTGKESSICERTAQNWLRKLGYTCKDVKKGLYFDGHERPDVVAARTEFLAEMERYERLMTRYDGPDLESIPPKLNPGEKEHVWIAQDETIFHTNEYRRRMWLKADQQPIKKKGNGRAIHVSDFICEPSGRLALNGVQRAEQEALPAEQRLQVTDARKIIYPGKNHDSWWDLPQLITQLRHAIKIFKVMFPDKIGVWVFDCSASHEGFAVDALNVNNMNVGPGGKQTCLRDTIIPKSNPAPRPGRADTRGQKQVMVFPADYHDKELQGKAKGMVQVLKERVSVWDIYQEKAETRKPTKKGKEFKPLGKCQMCTKSQAKLDAERRIAIAEATGQDTSVTDDDVAAANGPDLDTAREDWCCVYRVLSLQEDFANEKPLIRQVLEQEGQVCMFLPKFHCEMDPIEMVWGYAKYRYRDAADGKFKTAKDLVPHCLDSCDLATIRRFFRKSWRYVDAYRKGLNVEQAAFANRKYKQHRRVGVPAEVIAAMQLENRR